MQDWRRVHEFLSSQFLQLLGRDCIIIVQTLTVHLSDNEGAATQFDKDGWSYTCSSVLFLGLEASMCSMKHII